MEPTPTLGYYLSTMRSDTFAIVLFAVCTLVPAYGQKPVPTVGDAKVRHEILTIEEQWHKALERTDVDWLDRLLSDDWTITNGSGQMISKGELLKDLRNGGIRYESSTPSEIEIRLHGNTAVVTKVSTDKTSYSGQPGGGQARMTDVFAKEHGQWHCIASHASRLPSVSH